VIRLLGRQTSGNVQKVIFCLEEIRLPYVREDYGRQFGNTSTDEYRKLNPNAKVPTLIDGDLVIWESHTILRYLAEVQYRFNRRFNLASILARLLRAASVTSPRPAQFIRAAEVGR